MPTPDSNDYFPIYHYKGKYYYFLNDEVEEYLS